MRRLAVLPAILGLAICPVAASAAPIAATAAATDVSKDMPPFPADASVRQSVRLGKSRLSYTATVGSLPVRNEEGKKVAEVVFTAYVLDRSDIGRPVTFAFNGGPGAASVFLNFGALGPKHLAFGAQADTPSNRATVEDNPYTWLPFTDLVFIDPVGTGFSRSLLSKEEARKRFYAVKPDVEYLSRVVYDWLLKNGRMTSPKFLVGESYGGFRVPRIARQLQTVQGVGVSGIVMVSPYLDASIDEDRDLSPLPWMVRLPSLVAARLERQRLLDAAALRPVEEYARTEFLVDLMRGPADAAASQRLTKRVTELTGLDPVLTMRLGGRIDEDTVLREAWRKESRLGSNYDINVTTLDPFPNSATNRAGEAGLETLIAPTTSAMVDFATRVVGWKVEGDYHSVNSVVNDSWDYGSDVLQAVTALRQALALDVRLKALIAHGYTDLACPYFASRLIIDQMPREAGAARVQLKVYPGGHMFYSRPAARAAFFRDVQSIYAESSRGT